MTDQDTHLPLPAHVQLEDIVTPELEAFIGYWKSISDQPIGPPWKKFDLLALAVSSISKIVVADVRRDPLDFVYRFWGTAQTERKGMDKTGRSVVEVAPFRGGVAFNEYRWVMENKRPFASRDIVDLQEVSGRVPFEQRLVRLPLSDDGREVHHIITLAAWDKV